MKQYIDRSFLLNPLGEYFRWLRCKAKFQFKNWGKHLRIGYLTAVDNCSFGRNNILGSYCFVNNSVMGDFSYINGYSYVLHTTMGKYCSIGPNVKIAPGKHPTSVFVSTHPVTFSSQVNLKNFGTEQKFKNYEPVSLGNDVWIGANAIILDGVTIGNGAIVAANSVVVKNVGDYEIVGGNPAKFIKKRFDDDQIQYLLETRWWDNDEAWVQSNISKFWNIDDFMEYAKAV